MSKTRLIIARHGNTFGPGDTITRVGRTDLPLVASGLEQGRLIGAYLKQTALIPDLVFTSCLKRTQQTAAEAQKAMGTALAPQPLVIFDEIDYGPDENRPEEEVIARLGKEALEKWDKDAVVPEGWRVKPDDIIANWKKFAADAIKAQEGKTILVVTSNGTARFAPHLTCDFEGFRTNHAIKISTGALCIFEHENLAPAWTCAGWNIKPKDVIRS